MASKLVGLNRSEWLQLRNSSPNGNSGWGIVQRRPSPNVGKANVLREVTSECTLGATGVGAQTRGER